MRKRIALFAATATILGGVLLMRAPAQAQVVLNGRTINYTVQPFTIGGFYMVPLRQTLDSLGATTVWEPNRLSATFNYQGNTVTIRRMSGYAIVNNNGVVMGVPAVIRQGELFVPLSFFRDALGIPVDIRSASVSPTVRARVAGFRGTPADEQLHPGAVDIGGVTIIRLLSAGGFPSVQARVTDITTHLTTGLQHAMQLDNGAFYTRRVSLRYVNGAPVIAIAGVPVVTVTGDDAAAYNMSVDGVARMWLSQIRARLHQVYPDH